MGAIESKTFKSGNSVAIRLPKELGFAADMAVTIERVGNELKIVPLVDPAEEKRKLDKLVAALRAIGPVGEIEPREPIDFPDRPGLY
jgi:antitoxin VapB